MNAISNPEAYTNLSSTQTIFRRADPKDPSIHIVLFGKDIIRVVIIPTISNPSPLIYCGIDETGFRAFDLTEKIAEILSSQSLTDYSISFFETREDAELLVNKIANASSYTNSLPFSQIIYASLYVENELNCIDVVELELSVQDPCEDLSVSMVNCCNSPRPGFNFSNELIIENKGKTINSGIVEVNIDPDADFVGVFNSNPNFTVVPTSNGVNLKFTNMNANETASFFINMYCPPTLSLELIFLPMQVI